MGVASSSWTFLQLIQYFGPRVLFAILCGGAIGLERELKNKPAGIKTNILICLGSTLYTSVSILLSMSLSDKNHYGDPSRVAAQIVSGIGFLGGGTIIQARGTIIGLTTAATIWVVSAIGVCIGMGHLDIASFCSVCVIFVLVTSTAFEDKILGRSLPFCCEVVLEHPSAASEIRSKLTQLIEQHDLTLEDFQWTHRGKEKILTLHYSGHRKHHKKFMLDLWNVPGIEIK